MGEKCTFAVMDHFGDAPIKGKATAFKVKAAKSNVLEMMAKAKT